MKKLQLLAWLNSFLTDTWCFNSKDDRNWRHQITIHKDYHGNTSWSKENILFFREHILVSRTFCSMMKKLTKATRQLFWNKVLLLIEHVLSQKNSCYYLPDLNDSLCNLYVERSVHKVAYYLYFLDGKYTSIMKLFFFFPLQD